MTRQFWYVGHFIGQRAQLKLVDFNSGGWGHINFDDLKGDIACSNVENTGIYFANDVQNSKIDIMGST